MFPVVLPGASFDDVPFALKGTQALIVRSDSELDRAANDLARALRAVGSDAA